MLDRFAHFPLLDLASLLQGRRPLVLAPHPDDESLGCGGLIAACCASGIAPIVIILTDGSASHPGSELWPPDQLAQLREREAVRATAFLGLPEEQLFFFRQPDAALAREGQAFEKLLDRAAKIGRAQGCGVVVGPWHGDPHCDHEAGALLAAAVAQRGGCRQLAYPVWGWLRDAEPPGPRQSGWRLDISPYLALKKRAIEAHVSQFKAAIADCPQGFSLPEQLLEIASRPYEVFLG